MFNSEMTSGKRSTQKANIQESKESEQQKAVVKTQLPNILSRYAKANRSQ
jgi:hypothetical protein